MLRIFACFFITLLVASMLNVVTVVGAAGPQFSWFHMTFNLFIDQDGTIWWGYGINGIIHNMNDVGGDGEVLEIYENGVLLIDIVTIDPEGSEYSISNGDYLWYFMPGGVRDALYFEYQEFPATPSPPVGMYVSYLKRLADGNILDTLTFNTPYKNATEDPTLPPLRFPELVSPLNDATISDATPTIQWTPFDNEFENTEQEWGVYLSWDSYGWLLHGNIWNPSPNEMLVTFPDALEHPQANLEKRAPAGEEFPLKLPRLTTCWLELVAREWFLEGYPEWDPRCSFCAAYGRIITFTVGALEAKIDIKPDCLNLKSRGKWLTAYVELPEGYDVADINVSTVMLNNSIPVDPFGPVAVGDYDGDATPDLMVKFNRTEVVQHILGLGIVYGNVTLVVTGRLNDGTLFEGTGVIKVLGLIGDVNCDGKVDILDIVQAAQCFASGEEEPKWNANANFASPWENIDIFDLVTMAKHYGEKYP